FLHRLLDHAQVDEDARVWIRLAPQGHGELVVMAVQIDALPLVARQPVRGGEAELGLDLVHGHLVARSILDALEGPSLRGFAPASAHRCERFERFRNRSGPRSVSWRRREGGPSWGT